MNTTPRETIIYEGLAETTAVILAGGLGTRLRSVVADRPKVLAEVSGRPFLEYLFEQLERSGIKRVLLCTGYLGEQIERCYGARYSSIDLHYSREAAPLGTGGALRLALPKVPGARMLVLNGDSFAEEDFEKLYEAHRDGNLLSPREGATIALVRVGDTSRFGQVRFAVSTRRVQSFEEKASSSGAGWINSGVYLIPHALLGELPAGQVLSLEREVFPSWAHKGLLAACPFEEATFIDVGTPESYRQAHALFGGRP